MISLTRSSIAPLFTFLLLTATFASPGCGGDPPTTSSSSSGSSSSGGGGMGGDGGGGGPSTSSSSSSSGGKGCGNGVVEGQEKCDGMDLGGATCATVNPLFFGGELGCNADCTFDTMNCLAKEDCTDGTDNDKDGDIDCADSECTAMCADPCAGAAIAADPGLLLGSTVGHANLQDATCTKNTGSGAELVYEVTPQNDGVLEVVLTSDANLAVSAKITCEQPAELGCMTAAGGPGTPATLRIPSVMGQPVFIVVQGFSTNDAGTFTLDVRSRPVMCGDGFTDLSEECDDGNTSSNDGCSAACTVEATETEANNTSATADSYVKPWYASIAPAGDVDFVAVNVPSLPAAINATVSDFDGTSCSGFLLDSLLEVYAPNGVTKIASADNGAVGSCSKVQALPSTTGIHYVRVSAGLGAALDTFAYKLDVTVSNAICGNNMVEAGEQCDDGNTSPGDGCGATCQYEIDEVEPNGTTGMSNTFVSPWAAAISPAGDVDVVKVSVPGPNSTINAQVIELNAGDCFNFIVLSNLELIDKNGTTVLVNDNGSGPGYCAALTKAGLSAGTYYLRVKANSLSPNATFSYGLNVTIN